MNINTHSGQCVQKQRTMKSAVILLLNLAAALTNDVQEFAAGNNLFTASVYREISKSGKENFLVSPLSATTVLSLAQSGAKGLTGQEIRNNLHLPNGKNRVESAIRVLFRELRNTHSYSLQFANKIYVKQDYPIKQDFRLVAFNVHEADVENIDFVQNNQAAATINDWVEKHTNHKIRNLINPHGLDDRIRAILINALYFQGNWSDPFEFHLTKKQNFYKNANSVFQLDTMHNPYLETNYYESPELDAKFLEIPFGEGDAVMTVVLPNNKEGLASLEKQLNSVFSTPVRNKETVNVALPRFRIETKLDLTEILKKLGVRKAFKDGEADLSGIAGRKGDLVISDVLQKTFIDVNENGVEAAAATFVNTVIPLSGYFPSDLPKEFIADHPFIFYIKVKGVIVIAGRVLDPRN